MDDRRSRAVIYLAAAGVALLVLVANTLNEGPELITQVASAVLVIGGALGAIQLVRVYLER